MKSGRRPALRTSLRPAMRAAIYQAKLKNALTLGGQVLTLGGKPLTLSPP
jgi:hypothetical protein